MYIALEGLDGCGKNLQIDLLTKVFSKAGISYLCVAEPDEDNPIGQLLRKCLKTGTCIPAHAALFLADRMTLIPEKIIPALNAGKAVISSRSFLSTLVYQQENWPSEWLESLHAQLQRKPDLIFILDVSPDEALKRIQMRAEGSEFYEKREILERTRKRYLEYAQEHPDHACVINGNETPEKVHADILEQLFNYYRKSE